jgi:hypothetical protein
MIEKITTKVELLKAIEFLLWTGPINEYGIPVYQDVYDEIERTLNQQNIYG